MIETTTLTPLGHQILEHWRRHRPTMVEKLDQRESTSAGDLRSAGVDGEPAIRVDGGSEDGLPIAWEIATREWAFLPDEEDQPQLSFDPATLDPHQPLPAISA